MNRPAVQGTFLLVLSERMGLAWVLRNQRMAFAASTIRSAEKLKPGDRLFLYTTRNCFHNPTIDRGRVVGEAEVLDNVRRRREPLIILDRSFTHDCPIELRTLTAYRTGLELAPLVERLHAFPDKRSWAA